MDRISRILGTERKPALLIGNGINRFHGSESTSWAALLRTLAKPYGLDSPNTKTDEMSFTEFFDIVDFAGTAKGASILRQRAKVLRQRACHRLKQWTPSDHHRVIVGWARRHGVPIVTVNFDENLSRSIGANFHRGNRGNGSKGFTDWYPWSSYFSDREINAPRNSFAIWHAHGMVRYERSIQLGLTHYMRSLRRADSFVYGRENSLRGFFENGNEIWRGHNTWLDIMFFCPLLVFGFGCNRDESFLRWLFLQRARLHKSRPEMRVKAWFLDTSSKGPTNKRFFEELDMEYVRVPAFEDIYESPAWRS